MRATTCAILLSLVAIAGCGYSRSTADSRAVALWVLDHGGRLGIDESTVEISRPNQLPDGRFEILRIELDGTPIGNNDLTQLGLITRNQHIQVRKCINQH